MTKPQIRPLAAFNDNFYKHYKTSSDFGLWAAFGNIYDIGAFREVSGDEFYSTFDSSDINLNFIDTQIKFYIYRHGRLGLDKLTLNEILHNWVDSMEKTFPTDNIKVNEIVDRFSTKKGLYRYLYHPKRYLNYLSNWFLQEMTLEEWMKHENLLVEAELMFSIDFMKHEKLKFPVYFMKQLFMEYVQIIYNEILAPRLKSPILKKMDKNLLDRLFENKASDDDLSQISQLFNLSSTEDFYSKLSIVLTEDFTLNDIDIHYRSNLSNYCALVMYYKSLNQKNKKEKTTICIKNMPTNKKKKDDVYAALQDIFDAVHQYCPEASWSDFKSIFSQNGSTVKIIWSGDAQILRFLFACLGFSLEYSPDKWEAVCYYFRPSEDDDFHPKKLQSNSGYKDETIENLVDDFKNILNQ
jgi:hypothetical protein